MAMSCFVYFTVFVLHISSAASDAPVYHVEAYFKAFVNITYRDSSSGKIMSQKQEMGQFGTNGRVDAESGMLVHVRTAENKTHGCSPPVNVPSKGRWIALVQRGGCKFTDKIRNTAVLSNASAVVIYDDKETKSLVSMEHTVETVVSIFVSKENGEKLSRLVDNGTKVMMYITVGSQVPGDANYNKTSVLFVSISFIILMIISLAWLVFYYIQRFRYAHAKERLSKRLKNAAKKAITKMPVRTIWPGDKECNILEYQCAVCIESYRPLEVVRVLPCHHFFHKLCVDPWLIDQRSCPMCKLDILKAYGLQIHGLHSDDPTSHISMGEQEANADNIHVDAHPSSSAAEAICVEINSPQDETKLNKNKRPHTISEESFSTDMDSNELQALMPPSGDIPSETNSPSSITDKTDLQT